MVKLVVLGISGSIGKQTLSLIEEFNDVFELVGCSVNNNIEFLNKVLEDHKSIQKVCIGNKKDLLEVNTGEVVFGEEGLKELVNLDCDLVVNAISGIAGLYPTIEAIRANKDIALANKESIVVGGELIMDELVNHPNVSIYPIDSEHSAIFQCLNGENIEDVSKVIITCSGGALRDYSKEELENVSVKQALSHPNWKMGNKITVDCATLFNKGFEIVEAHYLFGLNYDEIETVMHKQSIVHSLVEYKDGCIKALLGSHDMRLNILYAISKLKRLPNSIEKLDLLKVKDLTFEPINKEVFKGIDLVLEAASIGGSALTCLEVANEVAVDYFLDNKIKFLDIYEVVHEMLHEHEVIRELSIDVIKNVEKETRTKTKEFIERRYL